MAISMFFDSSMLQEVIKQLRIKGILSEDEENTCLSRMQVVGLKNAELVLKTPSLYYKDRFNELYQEEIARQVSEMEGTPIRVTFILGEKIEKLEENSKKNNISTAKNIDSEDQKKAYKRPDGLRDHYSFENFVTGDSNQFAQRATFAIAKSPGTKYNPCLIYGGVGLGKTHLLQAIGNYIFEHNPKLKIIYVTAEQFYTEFISGINDSQAKATAFRQRYRNADVLLMDDIHSFKKKEASQEELFHTFNDLYDGKKQIVFTCDRPISELKSISERLKSRFERAVMIDLHTPNFETKVAIIQKKLQDFNTSFPNDVIELIAETIKTNVRDLESAITNIHAYADLTGKEVTLELSQERLKVSTGAQTTTVVSIARIQRVISEYFNVSLNDLKGKKRNKSIVYPRQLAMHICREMTDFPITEIGLEFGGRDHTTVMHALQKISDLKVTDPTLDAMIQSLIRSVREHQDPI
ncbi:MAG: chromosomal replication initiator protein DnaA [Spirochaetia bacterium]